MDFSNPVWFDLEESAPPAPAPLSVSSPGEGGAPAREDLRPKEKASVLPEVANFGLTAPPAADSWWVREGGGGGSADSWWVREGEGGGMSRLRECDGQIYGSIRLNQAQSGSIRLDQAQSGSIRLNQAQWAAWQRIPCRMSVKPVESWMAGSHMASVPMQG
jgi:hypothetical protein